MGSAYTEQSVSPHLGYAVRDIVTPESAFYYWTPECDEGVLLEHGEKEGFTYFPVKLNGVFKSVMKLDSLKSGDRDIVPLTSEWLIAADTPILHLLKLFAQDNTRNFFVLSSSEIIGMVSPADLNRIPARASIYLLVAHFETLLTELIRQKIGETDEELSQYLSENRVTKATDLRDQERRVDLELPLIHYLNMFDLVEIIKHHDNLRKLLGFESKNSCNVLKFETVRNAISHQNRLLINPNEDIKKIHADCNIMIESIEKMSKILKNPIT